MKNFIKILSLASCLLLLVSSSALAALIPNDQYFSNQWGLDNHEQFVVQRRSVKLKAWADDVDINAPEAWEIVYNNTIDHILTDDPVIIAIIDTGVNYNHEDLKDNILRDENNKIIGYDFLENDDDPMDNNGHGTMIASIADASGNNNIGMAGVSWNAKIMPIRILDDHGRGDTATILKAIKYAADHGADIINLSIISDEFDESITQVIEYAYSKGAVIVAAAGNDNADLSKTPLSPINNDNNKNMIIGVGALNSADKRFEKSNYGEGVDIGAPGTNLLAASYNALSNESDYEFVSGTSAATALVSGGAALIKSYHPDWSNKKIINSILESASVFKEENEGMGVGRLNLASALAVPLRDKGQAIKTEKDNTVYITIEGGSIIPIASVDVFLRLGYTWDEVITISEYELNLYERKFPLSSSWLPTSGKVIKNNKDKTVYLVDTYSIRGFETWESFVSMGYFLNDIVIMPYTVVEAYKKGKTIK